MEESGLDQGDWGLISIGVGGAAIITGAIFGVIAQADADRYHRNTNTPSRGEIRQAAIDEALYADISYAASGAFILAGLILILTEESEEEYDSTDPVWIDVEPSGDAWSVSLGGHF